MLRKFLEKPEVFLRVRVTKSAPAMSSNKHKTQKHQGRTTPGIYAEKKKPQCRHMLLAFPVDHWPRVASAEKVAKAFPAEAPIHVGYDTLLRILLAANVHKMPKVLSLDYL